MDTTTPAPRSSRSRSRRSRALVAAGITGAVTVAGALSASTASAAELRPVGEVKTALRTVDPALQVAIKLPWPGGGCCIVCGLGGYDPIFGPSDPFGPMGL